MAHDPTGTKAVEDESPQAIKRAHPSREAHDPTGTKAVEDESLKQLNVLIPHEKLETLHRLKAVCGVPLTGLVRACIDLFSMAHDAESQGGKVVIVSADGKERLEVQLPRGEIRTVPAGTWRVGETESPAQP